MGLDVYVGSLTRYYCGDWESKAARMCREDGTPFQVIRPGGTAPPIRPDEVGPMVLQWQADMCDELRLRLQSPLDWSEDFAGPYFTDRPGWDAYFGVVLWAAYEEHPELARRERVPNDVTSDPALAASRAEGFRSRYPSLISDVEMWLPGEFDFTFLAPALTGDETGIGSSVALLEELRDLNARTWNADDGLLAEWRRTCPVGAEPLESHARFGLAVLLDLARLSVDHRLPMKLDY